MLKCTPWCQRHISGPVGENLTSGDEDGILSITIRSEIGGKERNTYRYPERDPSALRVRQISTLGQKREDVEG